jgi:hypothetical protein
MVQGRILSRVRPLPVFRFRWGGTRPARGGPLRLGPDADGLRDAIDVVEEGDHLDRIVYRRVAPALLPQPLDRVLLDRGGLTGQQDGEVAERTDARLEVGVPVVVGCMAG